MNACPVCGNDSATLTAQGGHASGVRRRSWYVSCPTCPTSFAISLELLNRFAASPSQASQLRNRWVRLMSEAAKRGEKMTRLY